MSSVVTLFIPPNLLPKNRGINYGELENHFGDEVLKEINQDILSFLIKNSAEHQQWK